MLNALPQNSNIEFDFRRENNSHNKNVLTDFFSLFNFDVLIHSHSNFSISAACINDYMATCTLKSKESFFPIELEVSLDEKLYKAHIVNQPKY